MKNKILIGLGLVALLADSPVLAEKKYDTGASDVSWSVKVAQRRSPTPLSHTGGCSIRQQALINPQCLIADPGAHDRDYVTRDICREQLGDSLS